MSNGGDRIMHILICSKDTDTYEQIRKALANVPNMTLRFSQELCSEPADLPSDIDIAMCDIGRGKSLEPVTTIMAHGIPVIALKDKHTDSDDIPPVLQIIEKPILEREAVRLLQTVTGLFQVHEIMKASRFQRQLLDSIPDIVMVINDRYQVIRINRAMLIHLSTPHSSINSKAFREVLGKKCHEIMFNRSRPCHMYGDRCPLKELRSTSASITDSTISCNDRHFQLTMTPLLELDETPVYFVEVIRDISIRHLAAEAMKTRSAFEQIIARACADLIVNTEVTAVMDGISQAMDRMAGFIHADRWYLLEWNDVKTRWDTLYQETSESGTGKNPQKCLDTSQLSKWSLFRRRLVSESSILHVPSRRKADSGSPHDYLSRNGISAILMMPLLKGADIIRVLGFETFRGEFEWPPDILIMFRVFGEALNNAVERNRNAINLRREEERYRRLTDNLPDLIWRIRMTGEVEYVNPSILTILGYPREMVIGSKIDQYLPHLDLQRITNLLSRLEAGEITKKYIHMQVDLRHRNGQMLPCEMGMTFDRDSSGCAIAIEGILRDLSEFHRAEREKAELQQRFFRTQRLEAIGSMASGLAHEINNPIGIIIGFSEFLIDSAELQDNQIENIRLIHQEALRIKELTQRLLDFARAGEFEVKQLDILKPVTDCIKLILHAFKRRNIELHTHYASDLPEIMGNSNALKQVIMNLLINAMEAIPKEIPGLVEIRIEKTVLSDRPAIRLRITDNGIGIPVDVREHIFDPFFSRKDTGSGLGLSISAAIVENHHGILACESDPENGTTFILDLPVSYGLTDNPEGEGIHE